MNLSCLSPYSAAAPFGFPDAFLEGYPGLLLQHHGVGRPVREVHECGWRLVLLKFSLKTFCLCFVLICLSLLVFVPGVLPECEGRLAGSHRHHRPVREVGGSGDGAQQQVTARETPDQTPAGASPLMALHVGLVSTTGSWPSTRHCATTWTLAPPWRR